MNNSWMAGTTYTPASGLGSMFKRGLDGGVQGLSQKGLGAFGAGLQGAGLGMMQQQGQMGGNPMGAFAGGLQHGQQLQRQQRMDAALGNNAPQGAFDLRRLLGAA